MRAARSTGSTRRRRAAVGGRCGSDGTGNHGFTLVEVLVTLVILTVLAVTLQRGIIGSRAALARAANWRAAADIARDLLVTNPAVADPAGRTSSGTTAGHDWTLAIEPLSLPTAAIGQSAQAWLPMRIAVQVKVARGTVFTAETVRIAKVATQ